MHNSPSRAQNHKEQYRHKPTSSYKHHTQHGYAKCPDTGSDFQLLDLPTESLTHVTSFLDPNSLFALAGVSKRLHEHIEDENTWRRAFVYQFLGIPPEGDIYVSSNPDGVPGKALILRREETSWKREFVHRWNLRRRWENVRPTTISHVPLHSNVSEIHLMPSASSAPALLTASLRYGVVARSYPLTGKILRGYLDASGTLNGIGNGNPNAEFTPDVTRCVLSADGGTARVLWGFRTGAVAVTTASRAMESARAVGARYVRCTVADAHEGTVEDAAWVADNGNASTFFITGGADGRVKIWDAKKAACVWTSSPKIGQVIKDPCVKVAVDATAGVVAAALKSGEIIVWAGFSAVFSEAVTSVDESLVQETWIPSPPNNAIPGPYSNASTLLITSLYLYCQSPSTIAVLSAYEGHPRLYRSTIGVSGAAIDSVAFASETMGAVTALQPMFASKPGEHSFIMVGDQLGAVSIFPWNGIPSAVQTGSSSTSPIIRTILPSRKIQAHDDAAVTALAWTPAVLVTGSSKGSLRAFDSLTLLPLRSFAYSLARTGIEEVNGIVVNRDFFAASIGDRVIAWRGEPQAKAEKTWKAKRSGTRASNVVAKYYQQVEISREIHESRRDLDYEQEHVRRNFGREREQNSTLEHLGLTEVEAVEYILMLSRDEEERRRLAAEQNGHNEVLLGEFDEDVDTPVISRPSFLDASSSNAASFASRSGLRPAVVPSSSNAKVQVSPRPRPEPMEAGFAAGSPLSLSSSFSSSGSRAISRTNSQTPLPDDAAHFPSMSSTPTHQSASGSPRSVRSAWSTPLRSARSSEGPSAGGSAAGSPTVARSPGVSLLSAKIAAAAVAEEDDEDLRYALELSLAEARSRGEDV
ncbi:hypothetical protein PHLGIDRAFT_447695 [Phlebiopsis gigantea 11061_1 CR5-6]|uniref:F-box domain-containing protein n=1 Tax=Phlebiopsis gigantea (strain 11061_1 CR5-6) TaxID=745531 RepID=A0A0C3PKF1_PHLG1|nr:hypothetical protein PHLGIDRAFT_447695 [Phlebiopsis gigantea 11061_1 CR5-6]